MKNKMKMKWAAQGGSIFCVEEEQVKSEAGYPIKIHQSIAFNLKPEIAKRLVELHNEELELS